jgi:hypothetical protein
MIVKQLFLLLILMAVPAHADSWIFLPSTYSHDASGQRVWQYARPPDVFCPDLYPSYGRWPYDAWPCPLYVPYWQPYPRSSHRHH